MKITREDLRVAGRLVATSTEGVICDASQVYSEDYVNKYNRLPQFKTNGYQSSINDKVLELYTSIKDRVDSTVINEAIPEEWLKNNLI